MARATTPVEAEMCMTQSTPALLIGPCLHQLGWRWRQQVLLITKFPAEPGMALSPWFEVSGHHGQQMRFFRRSLVTGGANEEARTERRIPANVMTSAHAILEEAGQKEALGPRRLHEMSVLGNCGIEHEVIEDGGESGWRRHFELGAGRDLRIVCEHTGVVKQFTAVDAR